MDELAFKIIFSICLTWFIILTPPLLIRRFRKEPFSKKHGIMISTALGFANLFLFIIIGSENKNHPVVVLGIWATYYILTRQKKGGDIQTPSEPIATAPSVPEKQENLTPISNDSPTGFTKIISNLSAFNYRKGLLRLWVVCALLWVPFSIYSDIDQVNKTFDYYFDKESIKKEETSHYVSKISELKRWKESVSKQKTMRKGFKAPEPLVGISRYSTLIESLERFAGLSYDPIESLEDTYHGVQKATAIETRRESAKLISYIDTHINRYETFIRDYEPEKPNYEWLLNAFITPLLAIPAAIGAFLVARILFKTISWVTRGFSPNK